jgi:hypothetical protein
MLHDGAFWRAFYERHVYFYRCRVSYPWADEVLGEQSGILEINIKVLALVHGASILLAVLLSSGL